MKARLLFALLAMVASGFAQAGFYGEVTTHLKAGDARVRWTVPVVNETNLAGEFRFAVESSKGAQNDFLDRLREQTGLAMAPAQRDVEILVFHPR